MMALVGFAIGYVVGVQQGKEGMARLIESWKQIQGSEEFAAAIESGRELLLGMVKQAKGFGGQHLPPPHEMDARRHPEGGGALEFDMVTETDQPERE